MKSEREPGRSEWCIVAADDHAPEWVPYGALQLHPVPVQYGRLGGSATLLQQALHRAASIASTSKILVTALDEYRHLWEPTLWCVRPEMRFVRDEHTSPLLASAAAILSIARISPSSVVTILPARCYVGQEEVLRQALGELARELPHVPEGAVSLGMLDIDAGVDEDYFVVGRPGTGPGLAVHGVAQRPTAWVARHLRRQGALVSSGIMRAYAGTLAEHIAKHWPQTSQELTALVAMKGADQAECEIPHLIQRRMPVAVMNSLQWHPPAFPQRVLTVCESEWSGLRSSHAVARIAECVENLTPWRLPPLTRPIIPYRRESVAS